MNEGPVGILNVLKPPGPTSHDVVAKLRRILGERKIGHGGTLDPGAAGVLPVLVGRATKLMPFVLDHPKVYRVEMTLGIATDTQDASGATVKFETGFAIKPTALADALFAFIGEIEQVPPMASAVRSGGKRLYELARAGQTIEREPRKVRIYEIHVRAIWPEDSEVLVTGARVLLDVRCSRGTYMRTLCHDIGERLGCGAHMSFLVRTAVGPFTLDQAVTLEDLEAAARQGEWRRHLLPAGAALEHLPRVEVDRMGAARLRQGQAVPVPEGSEAEEFALVQVVEASSGVVCVATVGVERDTLVVRPVRVL